MSDEQQLSKLPAPAVDWQARAEKAEAAIARVRDLAKRHANLSVSNGSWQMASRHCGTAILKALEDK